MIRALIAGLVVFLVATFPATWLLMLFLGNAGVNVSYWGGVAARHPRLSPHRSGRGAGGPGIGAEWSGAIGGLERRITEPRTAPGGAWPCCSRTRIEGKLASGRMAHAVEICASADAMFNV